MIIISSMIKDLLYYAMDYRLLYIQINKELNKTLANRKDHTNNVVT